MNGLALDSGEFISADELNAKWLPRKATEEEMSKEQPEALRLPTLPFAVFDEFGQPCEDRVRDHFAAAFDELRAQIGQGVPDEQRMRNLLARYENQWHRMGELWERCQGKGWPEAESKEFARLRDELTPATRALLLAYTQPAPQTDRSGCTAGTDEECKHRHCATQCPKRAQIGQGEPVAWVDPGDFELMQSQGRGVIVWPKNYPNATMPLYTHPAPQQKPLTDEQDRALCEAYCNAASDEYFKARPQLDSSANRRIFYAGHRKAWIEWQAAHNIGEKK